MARKNSKQAATNGDANIGYEAQPQQMAEALRGSMDAAECKHVCLGLLFLKYISDAFEEKHAARHGSALFCRYELPQPLEVIEADIKVLEDDIKRMLGEVTS